MYNYTTDKNIKVEFSIIGFETTIILINTEDLAKCI